MTMTESEKRAFKMHPRLLYDVIKRQAGTLTKAILEGVMNSIDAKASECRVTLNEDGMTIEDDGSGITDKDQIERFFETFGTPHEESERKTFGTFRMGRGQIFAYGSNVWRTGPFEMRVDVQNLGLDYQLITHQQFEPGCKIVVKFYTRLLPSDLHEAQRELQKWVRYAQIPVLLNGKRLSVDPATEEWDHVLDEAYIRLKSSTAVELYNLGVFVCDIPSYRIGSGGVVIARKQLKMNFARNDVMDDCQVWKVVKPFLRTEAKAKIRKEAMQPWERTRLIQSWLDRGPSCDDEEWEQKLCLTCNNRAFALSSMLPLGGMIKDYSRTVTHCRDYDALGDRVLQRKLALVISDRTLEDFGFVSSDDGLKRFIDMVWKIYVGDHNSAQSDIFWSVKPLSSFQPMLKGQGSIIDEKKWTPAMRVWARFANIQMTQIHSHPRTIRFGEMDGVAAWTDGATYVAFDRRFVSSLEFDIDGCTRFLVTLLHEFSHLDSDSVSHVHNVEFYEREARYFHDVLPLMMHYALPRLKHSLEVAGRQLNKKTLKAMDLAEKARRQADEFQKEAKKCPPASD